MAGMGYNGWGYNRGGRRAAPKEKTLQAKHVMDVGGDEEKAWLNKMQTQIANSDMDYAEYLYKENLSADNQEADMFMRIQHLRMFNMCAAPLANGINRNSLIQSIGMYMGMRLIDKSFRRDVSRSVGAALYTPLASMAEKNPKWAKYRDKCLEQANGGRMPWTAETAACQQLAFSKAAYADMRKPGADVESIMRTYNDAVEALYTSAKGDGIDRDDIKQSVNFIIGKNFETNPETAMFFQQLAYEGVIQRGYEEQEIPVIGDDNRIKYEKRMVWSGEFVDNTGEAFTDVFAPREPVKPDEAEHLVRVSYRESLQHMSSGRTLNPEQMKRLCEVMYYMSPDDVKKMSVDKIPGSIRVGMHRTLREKFDDYIAEGSPQAKYDSIVNKMNVQMLHQDGYSADEARAICTSAIQNAIRDECDTIMTGAINAAKDIVNDMKNAQQNQQGSGRGHEFDDLFNQWAQDNDIGYQYDADV